LYIIFLKHSDFSDLNFPLFADFLMIFPVKSLKSSVLRCDLRNPAVILVDQGGNDGRTSGCPYGTGICHVRHYSQVSQVLGRAGLITIVI
jgi:hypothetical protein